jgi:hypothetical protein
MSSILDRKIVSERPTQCPKLCNAPRILVEPHVGFSSAIRTIRLWICARMPARPCRCVTYVHLRAISRRCHRRLVSGDTIVATWRNTRRLRGFPRVGAAARLSAAVSGHAELTSQAAVLFDQRMHVQPGDVEDFLDEQRIIRQLKVSLRCG